jgi:hypothetical protein
VNEIPPEVRQKYEQAIRSLGDANNNNIPDAFESLNILADKDQNGIPDLVENLVAGQAAVSSMKIVIDGKEFNGIENLPPEARARYEAAMGKLDANGNGIPDFVEEMMISNRPAQLSPDFGMEIAPRSAPLPVSPTITPDTSNGWMLALAVLFLLVLCLGGAAGVWYFFLR